MLVGREKEMSLLKSVVTDDRPHFIVIYGRRRIGKTFLIREVFGDRFTFQHTGVFDGDLKTQLSAFDSSLRDNGMTLFRIVEFITVILIVKNRVALSWTTL